MESLEVWRVVEATLLRLRGQLFEKGAKGLQGVARAFRLADFDNSEHLDKEEFQEALQFAGLFTTSQELSAFFKYFDHSGDGFVDFNEFIGALRGELNARRLGMVEKVFGALDRDGSGYLSVEDMRGSFNAKGHPEVAAGRATEDDVLRSYLNTFEGERKDNRVTLDEFAAYYTDIGASVPDDDYFVQLVGECWGVTESATNAADVEKVHRYEELLREKVRQTCKSTESPKTRLTRVFKFFDVDGTGAVTIDEMTNALQQLGLPLPRKDVLLFFALYDADGSGQIVYDELVGRLYPDA